MCYCCTWLFCVREVLGLGEQDKRLRGAVAVECTEQLLGNAGTEGFYMEGKTQFVWQNVSLSL